MSLILTPGKVTLSELSQIYWESSSVELNPEFKSVIENAARFVDQASKSDSPIYGINTGFGKLASTSIPGEQINSLQRNLILSHCCGVGDPLPENIVRLIMVLKLLSLGRGASGVSWELIELLGTILERGVIPLIPEQGSVGASGDLAPLAHMTAVLIGEGEAIFHGEKLSGMEALKAINCKPLILGPKTKGLQLIACKASIPDNVSPWKIASPSPIKTAVMWASGARSPEAPTDPCSGITGITPRSNNVPNSSINSQRTPEAPRPNESNLRTIISLTMFSGNGSPTPQQCERIRFRCNELICSLGILVLASLPNPVLIP